MKRSLLRAAFLVLVGAFLSAPFPARPQDLSDPAPAAEKLSLTAGKSRLIESSVPIERVSVGFGETAEATVTSPLEVLLNAKAAGETSLIIWQQGGGRLLYDVTVIPSRVAADDRLEAVYRELKRELPDQNADISYENNTVFLRGRVKDLNSAERAVSIASTLGRTVNLLYVDVPPVEPQILLHVRFATVDRSASLQLGMNIVSTGAGNTVGGISTQQFSSPQIGNTPGSSSPIVTLSDALNIFLFRPELNLMGAIQALQQNSLLEILAEPDVLALNGKAASFLAGGEFPFPSFQPAASGIGTVTVQFREYGVRLNFTPTLTPRGTIRLLVAPEVSALDFTNGLVIEGYAIPALTVRKVSTEIELAAGQSFAIGGLIDNQFTESMSKIPVLGDVPVLGKLFQSKSRTRNNTELLVIVTPELVNPLTPGQTAPEMKFPHPLIWPPAVSKGALAPVPEKNTAGDPIPVETLFHSLEREMPATAQPTAAPSAHPGTAQPVPRALPFN